MLAAQQRLYAQIHHHKASDQLSCGTTSDLCYDLVSDFHHEEAAQCLISRNFRSVVKHPYS